MPSMLKKSNANKLSLPSGIQKVFCGFTTLSGVAFMASDAANNLLTIWGDTISTILICLIPYNYP